MRLRAAAFLTLLVASAASAQELPDNFVYLRDIDASIVQDIRYATVNNFTGRRLPGYDAPECILRRSAALALRQVQMSLAPSGLSLKVYDCYRPARASRAMLDWAKDSADGDRNYFPKLEKKRLFARGYIALHSEHSTGSAVDLTVIKAGAPAAPFDPAARYGACTAPAAERAPDTSLDMGTGYDCFDQQSHTKSRAVTEEQRRNRELLLAAMRRQEFESYPREWWHFSYANPGKAPRHDFPIRPRENPRDGTRRPR